MITRISGKIIEKGQNYLILETGGFGYQVFLPTTVLQRIEEIPQIDGSITLITYHYFQLEPSRGTPVIIGFLNAIEKEFFEIFITVSGIGPKAALKALNQPISLIAQAIDKGDLSFLKTLPGIGQQRAKEIIAKLQNKVAKYSLIQDSEEHKEKTDTQVGIEEEALSVLLQLEYKKPEALAMIKKALSRSSEIDTTEKLLNEVYRQKQI